MAKDQKKFNELILAIKTDESIEEVDFSLLDLNSNDVKLLWKQLANPIINIKYVDLRYNCIDDDSAQFIAAILKRNKSLLEIDLSCNNITDAGAMAIAQTLTENISLMVLNLSGNKIMATGASAFAHALTKNESLQSLDLSANAIENEGTLAFATALLTNKTLRRLRLYNCKIKGEDLYYIARALIKNTSLISIDLGANRIDNSCAAVIALVLQENKSLRELYLSDNHLGFAYEGLKAFSSALAKNRFLKMLNLSMNCIGDISAKSIAIALIKNNSLQALDLSLNHISNEGALTMAKALLKNESLQWLELSDNDIDDDGVRYIADAIPQNQSLYFLGLGGWSRSRGDLVSDVGAFTVNKAVEQRYQNQCKLSKPGWYMFCCAARNYKVVKKKIISPGIYSAYEIHLKKSGACRVEFDKLMNKGTEYFIDIRTANEILGEGNSELKPFPGLSGIGNKSISLPNNILENNILPYLKPRALVIEIS